MNRLASMAASLALAAATALPAPAMADARDNERIAQWVIGLAALGVIAHAVDNARDERRPANQPQPQPNGNHPGQWNSGQWNSGQQAALPAQCLQRYRSAQGSETYFSSDCLIANYARARHLPLDCASTLRSGGSFETVFRPDCLRERGFAVPRR